MKQFIFSGSFELYMNTFTPKNSSSLETFELGTNGAKKSAGQQHTDHVNETLKQTIVYLNFTCLTKGAFLMSPES